MASTISTWYHNQYSTWNRTRRMQAPPFLARPETQTSRVTRAASRGDGDAVVNMGDLLPPPPSQTERKKKHDTLFGPSIGLVNPGPDWADQKPEQSEKSQLQDILTSELVNGWVEKSKEASQPTTTLQALVNLKRPSLRLSPITHDTSDSSPPSQTQQHALEFYFDCDAPKCGISLHVIAPPHTTASSTSSTRLINIFHTVVDGGFGRVLKLEEGAVLELDKYDIAAADAAPPVLTPVPTSTPAASAAYTPALAPTPDTAPQPKKRFTLRIRKRTHPHAAEETSHVNVSVAGPALQVVDVETPAGGSSAGAAAAGGAGADADATEKDAREKDEGGVRVLIRLEALDVNEHTLASPNSQATYLHIVRLGPAPAPNTTTPDTRPWVVRVVKREATIGPHTFHLHEIYGLTSHTGPAAQSSEANLPAQADAHTYPPTATGGIGEDDPTSECLLCLSSPREVVLLPCRHLVACKECAVNMVEFGAGGQLVHGEDNTGSGTGDANANTNANAAAGTGESADGAANAGMNEGEAGSGQPSTPAPVAPPPRPANTRRKRKAKGWFCPVCRQPYTSLLRISTVAPKGHGQGEKRHSHTGSGGEAKKEAVSTPIVQETPSEAGFGEGGADAASAAAPAADALPSETTEAARDEPSTDAV